MLLFHKSDPVYDAILLSCQRLNLEFCDAKTVETALQIFQNPISGGQHILIVDGRHNRFIDADSFGRSLRSTKGSQYTAMVVVVKKR